MIGKFIAFFGAFHSHVTELTREGVSLLSSPQFCYLKRCRHFHILKIFSSKQMNICLLATPPSAPTHPNADSNLSPMTYWVQVAADDITC